jgi:hypothetical protein
VAYVCVGPPLQAYEKVGFHRHRLVDVLEKGL